MTKQEIEKAIEKGESVWCGVKLKEIKLNKTDYYVFDGLLQNKVLGIAYFIKTLFKTKAEAEHYLHHANITRTEYLPFLSWEEFKSGKNITFKAKNGHEFLLKAKQESIYLWWLDTNNIWKTWDLTEENFYKAYDECVRLFRGG